MLHSCTSRGALRHRVVVAQAASSTAIHQRRSPAALNAPSLAYSTPGQTGVFRGSRLLSPLQQISKGPTANRRVVTLSFLGVGAPEAIVVAVVALIVFGPKGLAEAAKGLGRTLRSLQPAIREVLDVTQDLKGTLDKELGIQELQDSLRSPLASPGSKPSTAPRSLLLEGTDKDVSKPRSPLLEGTDKDVPIKSDISDADIEAMRQQSAAAAWGGQPPADTWGAAGSTSKASEGSKSAPASAAPPPNPFLANMSMEALEAEMQRRKAAASPAPPQQQQGTQPGGDGASNA